MSANHRYSTRSALKVTALAATACMALTACSSVKNMTSGMSASSVNPVNWVRPYKVDVIQGNFVSKEQVDQLKPGLTKAQVRDLLGTPLVADIFHVNRWDYVFTLKRRGVDTQSYKYTVYFKADLLERFEGDTMPSETEFIGTLANDRKVGKVPVLEATDEQLKSAEKSSASKAAAAAEPANNALPPPLAPPVTVYPPLEGPKQ
jgi:outer membrane protein assembly factor BamE